MPETAYNRVLLVEDDDTLAVVLGRVLNERGYETRRAADVTAAMEVVGGWSPEAAIVDLKLGHESGLELIPRLVAACPGIRIVVLTGYASIATAVQAVKLGASEYLSKPADIDRIVAALDGRPALEPEADIHSVRRLEWEHIQRVLQERGGNISAAARTLGMHRRTLQRKLAKRPSPK